MPKNKISEYSATNSANTDIGGINIDEGCAPSNINNAIREVMVQLKNFQTGASGDAFTFAGGVLISGTTNTISGAAVISGNINSSGTNTFSGTTVMSGANTISHAAGTVSLPSITVNGDTNTGIFFPAADTIAFAEGGAEAMRIDSSGNVGIGTSSQTQRFEVYNSATNSQCYGVFQNNRARNAAVLTKTTNGGFYTGTSIGTDTLCWQVYDETNGERMRIDSSGNVGIGATSLSYKLDIGTTSDASNYINIRTSTTGESGVFFSDTNSGQGGIRYSHTSDALRFFANDAEHMRIDSSGNVGIGKTPVNKRLEIYNATDTAIRLQNSTTGTTATDGFLLEAGGSDVSLVNYENGNMLFYTNTTERARITSDGSLLIQQSTRSDTATGMWWRINGAGGAESYFKATHNSSDSNLAVAYFNRQNSDGTIIGLQQADILEGTISVSGNTVSYNAFCGGHWSQLQEGRGYNPDIPRGTVMSSIGEMAEWKSVTWTETIEHPAIPAVEAKEAVLDEEGNVVEPAVEAVEGKDAWTESVPHREAYLGNLPIGATFEEGGFTKTVVDDGNERLPKVKISDVVGDKAVYGVFQTWDGVQDMLITSLGAFVVRIAAGVTVQIGDLLESNGDGCAKVQDDDVIRSKTIGKVTSTVATATYPDGSYTVPCVIYCG